MPSNPGKDILMIALGGNALIKKGQKGTLQEQFENLKVPIEQIAQLSLDYRLIVTHGNGPQVGNLLLQQEYCDEVPKMPLEILVAQTQGQIGYMIESSLDNEFMRRGLETRKLFVTVLSYVMVDEHDPAFRKPTKPIGPYFPKEMAHKLPFPCVETPFGCRRVVASPEPLTVVEKREIRKLLEMDYIVISCGGGGIPVIKESRSYHGVDAVIDKDLASCVLAREVGAATLLIATDVKGVALSYGKEEERYLPSMSVHEAEWHMSRGEFPEGSMGPKVMAAVRFLKGGGRRALITSVEDIFAGVMGRAGTEFTM